MYHKASSQKLLQVFSHMEDCEWLEVLIKSIKQPIIDGVKLPGFPPETLQISNIALSGETALRECFPLYCKIKRRAKELGVEVAHGTRILDFGCGWGRIIRFFLKDVLAKNLYGIDVDPALIYLCKKHVKYGNYRVCNQLPPTPFSDDSFDIVFAASVFTHLTEPLHIKWLAELSRLLRPGGVLVVTIQGRHFIEFCRSLREKKHDLELYNNLAKAFLDTEAALAEYDNGKFLYCQPGGVPEWQDSFYGQAIIPKSYIERVWTKYLYFKDYIDDKSLSIQVIVVMQKPFDKGEPNGEGLKYVQYIQHIESFLNNIYSSVAWKAFFTYYRLRDKLFPANTKRKNIAKLIIKVILKIIAETEKFFKKLLQN